ncbi:MAG: undecaprenyl-diphosphate phosphatase [Leptospiraceae bacterium]|nr:undecaprenyl-diphosphate phosphatase [Leptospiraceae bacterium]MDW8305834.1 undecaprenyl-diphosphate phosphatase [Leptospiraceae bacterium]
MELIIFVICLGLLQGITEFLPISSSGHLALLESLPIFQHHVQQLERHFPLLAFNVILHMGTILAIVGYMVQEVKDITHGFFKALWQKNYRSRHFMTGLLIFAGTVPLVSVPFFKHQVERAVKSLEAIGYFFLGNALLLLLADIFFRKMSRTKKPKNIYEMNMAQALVIGCFQALAVFPGISRSGATITSALFMHFEGSSAVRFSFLLSIPALIGAFAFEILDVLQHTTTPQLRVDLALLGIVSAYASGVLSIRFLAWLGQKMLFYPFGIYTAILGLLVLFYLKFYAVV